MAQVPKSGKGHPIAGGESRVRIPPWALVLYTDYRCQTLTAAIRTLGLWQGNRVFPISPQIALSVFVVSLVFRYIAFCPRLHFQSESMKSLFGCILHRHHHVVEIDRYLCFLSHHTRFPTHMLKNRSLSRLRPKRLRMFKSISMNFSSWRTKKSPCGC